MLLYGLGAYPLNHNSHLFLRFCYKQIPCKTSDVVHAEAFSFNLLSITVAHWTDNFVKKQLDNTLLKLKVSRMHRDSRPRCSFHSISVFLFIKATPTIVGEAFIFYL